MSRFDYLMSRRLQAQDPSFDSLIMAAYRKADTYNAAKLEIAFPAICQELRERYDAPGGYLKGEE